MPTARYEVIEKLDAAGRPTGVFRLARRNRTVFGLPLILCDHRHPDVESARACRYFADQEENFTALFGSIC